MVASLLAVSSACGDDGASSRAPDVAVDGDAEPDPLDQGDPAADPVVEPDALPDLADASDQTEAADEADLLSQLDEVPGTIETAGRAEMDLIVPAHEAAAPTADEIVIYYYRPDGNYAPWGVWIWASPGGDGANHWDFTQDFEVVEGVAYLKFNRDGSDVGGASPVASSGEMGIIVRQDAGWVKDGDDDRIWNVNSSNEIVVFSGDQTTYAYGPYVPQFRSARMTEGDVLDVRLSGRHALTARPSSNGFVVRDADGLRTYAVADVRNADDLANRFANYTDHLQVTLAEDVAIGPALVIDHPEYLQPLAINNQTLVVAALEAALPPAELALGAIYSAADSSVEFRVWTPLSSAVTARLYAASAAESPAYTLPLTLDEDTGVWSGTFDEVDPDGLFYDYLIANSRGTNACLDPYARSMDAYRNEGGAGRAAIVDLQAAEALPAGWAEDGYVELAQREDAIIYEVHVRDFTISPDADVVGDPGTYQAFIEKLPYLEDLGVTHIQLMPVLNFYFTDETDRSYEDSGTASGNNYNWGYDPHNYFTPEGWYASDPTDPYARVRELRELIVAIHDAGMGVLLDVVYNHVASPFLFDNVVPDYFFRTNPDGTLTASSGVGNDVASTRAMVRRLIVDSTVHWVEQYHVDGFRFDLMGLTDTITMEAAYAACAAINEDVLFEGEGWLLYNGPPGTRGTEQTYMSDTDNISVFNDEIRDLLKGGGFNDTATRFLTNAAQDTGDIFANLIGQPQSRYTADDPGDSMIYIAAHDNLALHDNIVHNTGLSDEDPDERQEIIDRLQIGNFLVLTGQGIAFIHAGQERGRSKPRLNATTEVTGNFVHNSYDSADTINQLVWTLDGPAQELHDFTRGLIALRSATPAFRIGDQADVEAATDFIDQSDGLALSYSVSWAGETYFILANARTSANVFDLGIDVSAADVLVDGDEATTDGVSEVTGVAIDGQEVTLEPLTQALLRLTD